MRRKWTTAVVLAVAMTTLAGCSVGGASSSDQAGIAEPGTPLDSGAAPESVTEGAAPDSAGVSPVEARSVISEGYVTITADDPIGAADEAAEIVEGAGGRIDSRSERPAADDGLASADLVVRIPAARLTETLDKLKELGEVEQVSITATDVTGQTRDLDARVSALQTSTGRLEALLASATTTSDLIDIESELSERQAELESLESQQRTLSDQVDLSTISVSFGSVAAAPIDRPNDFFSGVATGWEALAGFVAVTLIALGVALPWLLAAAVIAGIVVLLVVAAKRRRGRAVGSTPSSGPTTGGPPPAGVSTTPAPAAVSATSAPAGEASGSPAVGEASGSPTSGEATTRMDE